MDEFKKYIQQKASEMDVDEPSGRVWEQIAKQTSKPKARVFSMAARWAVAACVIFLAGIGFLLLQGGKETPIAKIARPVKKEIKAITAPRIDSPTIATIVPQKEKAIEAIATTRKLLPSSHNNNKAKLKPQTKAADNTGLAELENIESSFTQFINLQKARVNTMPLNAESPAFFVEFSQQMHRMEKDEVTVKKEIKKHGINNELLGQLINVYQQKLNVLKQLQNEMQKTNNRYKQGRSPVDPSKIYFLNI
ncbi:hypothetical protein [Parasediminibacterium sp. JCM 36343]|uniref:hypothetical protein n=1 Tax=Parasediminibacterium sp. JCM 36343 TaxID=3374279 RepID=UPI00397B4B09